MCSKTEWRDTFHIFDLLLLIFSFFKFFLQNFLGKRPAAGRPAAGQRPAVENLNLLSNGRPFAQKSFGEKIKKI